jgi:hypothetical protein
MARIVAKLELAPRSRDFTLILSPVDGFDDFTLPQSVALNLEPVVRIHIVPDRRRTTGATPLNLHVVRRARYLRATTDLDSQVVG